MSSDNNNTPFAWLGLLKWSLSFTDGTAQSSESPAMMSEEDKAFLEGVMKDGIVDEGERMKVILKDLAGYLERIRSKIEKEGEETKSNHPDLTEDDAVELLMELRDIVEQIDYARAFSAMGGLPFLLGCASERGAVPGQVRSSCLGVLATLAQNNPPVQYAMLEVGAIKSLIELYFRERADGARENGDDGSLTSRIVQALSCCVRGHAAAEKIFCDHADGRAVLESGLGVSSSVKEGEGSRPDPPPPPLALKKRCLFFLRALVTSDNSDAVRVGFFEPCIRQVASSFLDPVKEPEAEIREMGLGLLDTLLKAKKNIRAIVEMKDDLVGLGIRRVRELRDLEGEEREYANVELEYWESLVIELARADLSSTRSKEKESLGKSTTPLLLK